MARLHNSIKLHFKLGLRYDESTIDDINISIALAYFEEDFETLKTFGGVSGLKFTPQK